MKVLLIGTGLIGGSFVLGLKEKYPQPLKIFGFDKDPNHAIEAEKRGIINKIVADWRAMAQTADLIILAIPVNAIILELKDVLDACGHQTLVVEMGSTKADICQKLVNHPRRNQFLAAHPMAGTEYSGPQSAFSELFQNKVMIFCEAHLTQKQMLDQFKSLCALFDMRLAEMTPQQHDLHLAFVSHLSHVSSFALSHTVLSKETGEKEIFEMAGSGFASTVRLAKSSPEMWTPIFLQNKGNLEEALEAYINSLQHFLAQLKSGDEEGLKAYMQEANRIKPIIDDLP